MSAYNDHLPGEIQIDMEEWIANEIFYHEDVICGEEDAADLSRKILLEVLTRFRPDLLAHLPLSIDWEALHRQYHWLLNVPEEPHTEQREGLLNLLEAMLDDAEAAGLWEHPDETET